MLSFLLTLLISVLVFGLLIFIHELGHFLAAKAGGITVNEFSIGMGPRLFGFVRGQTQYSVRALPFGGYVMMEGEDEESDKEGS
ncbi:MAG TPA: site-2 protease family protein, partial [Candidatus Ruthenibacterium merdigallinarum]|nr:site-2 protease family protein [Candidatus Ruthenibacterium merdigallinarum]